MTLGQRRIIYIFFFALFLVSAPLLIWYSLGYRLDTSLWRVTKVGAIYVKSYPNGAKIYKNLTDSKRKTPSQIINIPIGLNTISVIKDGYQTWSKQLEVVAGQTTFIQDILLFKTSYKKTVLGIGGKQFLVSPERERYAFVDKEQYLTITNPIDKKSERLMLLPNTAQLQTWSPDLQFIAFSTGKSWSLVDTRTQKINPVVWPAVIKKLQFGDNNQIWLLSGNNLYQTNADNKEATLVSKKVIDFITSSNQIAILHENYDLELSDLLNLVFTKYSLANQPDLQLRESRNSFLVISSGEQLLLWSKGVIKQEVTASSYDWQKNKIFLSSGYELWVYDISADTLNLVDRSSNPVTMAGWHPSLSYYTDIKNNDLEIVELDDRGEKRHHIKIVPATEAEHYIYDTKGEVIFILNSQENYWLQIQ